AVEITIRAPRRLIADQLDDPDTADDADIADRWQRRQRREPVPQLRFEPRDALQDARFLKQIETRARDRAGERVRRERMAVEKGLRAVAAEERLEQSLRRHRGTERQIASGERLREADDIGCDRLMVAREHLAGAAETGEHFVGDEQRLVAVAQLPHAAE